MIERKTAPRRLAMVAVAALAAACTNVPSTLPPAVDQDQLSSGLRERLESSIATYEEIRSRLAHDDLAGLAEPAGRLVDGLAQARSIVSQEDPSAVDPYLQEVSAAAESLAQAPDLEGAREAFGEVSRFLIELAATDQRLASDWQVFECPMTPTFKKWMQPSSEIENPYMGTMMPSCGTASDWSSPPPVDPEEVEAHSEHAHGDPDDIAYYTCSMHPSVQQQQPGTCPICSMGLVAVTRQEVDTGIFVVGAERRQEIGVRTAPLRLESSNVTIRTVGRVAFDETRLSEVSLKYRGWIGTLFADQTGQFVRRGEPLLDLYSPKLYAAQEELLAAVASRQAAQETSAPQRADYLVEAARVRLGLWDLSESQIETVIESGEPVRYQPILSPVTGYVVEKNVVAGAAVEPAQSIFRIAGLDVVWVEAQVYESDLALVEVGQPAEVTLPYLPGQRFTGKVSFVYPYLDDTTRTGTIRIELANRALQLKPEMYANVELRAERGERLLVPVEAVLYAGPRRLVFVDLGEGRLRAQEIEIGIRSGDSYEVLSGLEPSAVVVVSGNFLIAAESRLKSATETWQ